MKVKVTEKGVMIPPEWLLDVEEVEIIQENDLIVVKKVPPDAFFEPLPDEELKQWE